jgi:xanthine dehydrogenase accessory factor
MHKMGMAADMVGKLVCPIGLTAIRDKAPAAIAASVAAQVMIVREQLQSITARDSQIASGQVRHG